MKLELSVKNPSASTLESLKISLALVNDSAVAYRLPGPYDLTQALSIEVYRAGGALVRRMNGLTRQEMMSSGRIDPTPLLEDLPAGGRWDWELDLAAYHYALPAGQFEIKAVYADEASGVLARSPSVPVVVTAAPLHCLAPLCDAPVIEGLTLLLRGGDAQTEAITVLRQHNAQRPLAAWYSERIDGAPASGVRWDGPTPPFFAAARFLTTDSFEPTFVKWILSTSPTHLFAHRVFRGRIDPVGLSCPLPTGRSLLPSACYDDDDRLTVFFQKPDGAIDACDFTASGLERRFRHQVPPTPIPPAIRVDCDFVHVVTPWQGAIYDRLSLDGVSQERKKPHTTRMTPVLCDIDPIRRRARLAFRDGPRGRALHLVTVAPKASQVDVLPMDQLLLRGELRELSFDEDNAGHFHLLVSTSRRGLYYLRDGMGPVLIARGEERFHPLVHAGSGAYLGCHSVEYGYRFLHFRPSAHHHRIASFDEVT